MSPLDWFKKQRPMLSMQSFGGGAAGLMISGAPPAIDASGGVKTTPGDGYVYHVFGLGGPATFAVASAGKGSDGVIDLCVVGGGGGGAKDRGGGGGAGGFRITTVDIASYGDGNYPCSIGGGGAGAPSSNANPPNAPPAVKEPKQLGHAGSASSFNIPGSISPSPISIIAGGGGGGGGGSSSDVPVGNGTPGNPYPYPTQAAPVPNATAFPGCGGGAKHKSDASSEGSPGAGPQFNSYPGRRGNGPQAGGGGGTGSGGPPESTSGTGGEGSQLPWALPTWGWGQSNPSGKSANAPTSDGSPGTGPQGPTGQSPWGYGWFAGGGGGGNNSGSSGGTTYAGGGLGAGPTMPSYDGAPTSGSDGLAGWGAFNTGSGGGGVGDSQMAGQGASGIVMLRYPVG